jgi:hypothetical protein
MTKRKQKKPDARQRQLKADWEATLAKHGVPLERGAKSKGILVSRTRKQEKLVLPSTNVDPSRDLRRHPSLETPGGSAAAKSSVQYTGSAMLGVGQMHKSNAVPVFSTEDAIDIARMRRN